MLLAETSGTAPAQDAGVRRPARIRLEYLLVFAAFAALSARLLLLISRFAVNVFFMDQWEFNEATLFQHHSLWEIFRWQHGPHRQGLGGIVAYLIEPRFHWNSRSDAFAAGIIVILAAAYALYIKKKLFGSITIFDVCIPLIFLTQLQYEAVLITANLTQGPIPLLVLLFYCMAWTVAPLTLRYALILIVNFLAVHTGYCFFLGVITPIALIGDYWLNRSQKPSRAFHFLIALALSLASLGVFFVHYVFTTEVDCAPNLFVSPASYLKFLLLIFANIFGVKGTGFLPTLAGTVVLAAFLTALVGAALVLPSETEANRPRLWTAAILLAFSLLFSVNAAYGRSCLDPQVAQVSRYVIWMEPGLAGLYFFLQSLPKSRLRTGLQVLLLASLLAAIPVRWQDERIMQFISSAKRNWKSCYLQIEDVRRCNHAVGYGVYQAVTPEFKDKLDFLKRTRQNLYAPE
jgi:hypothetical protein